MKSKINEAKIKKGDVIKMDDGEIGVVNKLSGKVAYIKLSSMPGKFHPIEADRITYKGKHKGKDLYSESKLEEHRKVGDKVKYLGHPAVITNVKDYNGNHYYSVSYNKGNGKTKASNILSGSGSITEVESKLTTESMIGIQTKANFKPNSLKGALERAGIKGFQMNRLSVTLTALKLDKKDFETAKKIIDTLPKAKIQMAKESVNEANESINEYYVENFIDTNEIVEYLKENSVITEAEYQGRKVELNKIMQGDVKKFKVYVNNPKGNVVKVNFGHGGSSAKKSGEKTMSIRKNNPGARKAFRARHNCDNPGPKHKARYWSCRKW